MQMGGCNTTKSHPKIVQMKPNQASVLSKLEIAHHH